MDGTLTADLQCPSCWECIEVIVDPSIARQEYTEDCSVCCRPMVISVLCRNGEILQLDVRSEED